MGTCCPKSPKSIDSSSIALIELEKPENQTTSTIDRISTDQVTMDTKNDLSLNLVSEFNEYDIESLMSQLQSEKDSYFSQLENLKSFDQGEFFSCEVFGKMFIDEVSNDSFVVMSEKFRTNSKAEFLLFAFINQIVKLSNSINHSEVLCSHTSCDTIYVVEAIKTKRVLVISPRSMIVLHIYKKIDNDTFIHLMQSVNLTKLIKCKPVAKAYSKLTDVKANIFISGQLIKNYNGFCEIESFSRSDFQLTVGFKLLKPFLIREYVKMLANYSKNCERLLVEDYSESQLKVIWFEQENNNSDKKEDSNFLQFLQERHRLEFFDDPAKAKASYKNALTALSQ